MPLDDRSIPAIIGVFAFFGICLIGLGYGLSPYTCSKRAVVGALLVYIGMRWMTRAVNAILTHAMITNWIQQQEQLSRDNQD